MDKTKTIEVTVSTASDLVKEMQIEVLNKNYAGASIYCHALKLLSNDLMKMLMIIGLLDSIENKTDTGDQAEEAVKKANAILDQNKAMLDKE